MGLAITFWPFGGKESDPPADADGGMEPDSVSEDSARESLGGRLQAWWRGGESGEESANSLMKRLHAWWEGDELPDAPAESMPQAEVVSGEGDEAAGEEKQPIEISPPDPAVVWTKERIDLVQSVWGEGFIWPGGGKYVQELINGLSLTPKISMLEVGAGLGAASCEAVAKFGTYITARDRNPALVEAGNVQLTIHDIVDKVEYKTFDPTNIDLKENYYEAVLVRDTMFNVEDKEGLLGDIIRSMKPEGQIMMTDFLFEDDTGGEELEKWREAEPEPVYAWSVGEIKKALKSNNVVMRIAEDESETYHQMALDTWNQFLQKIKKGEIERDAMGGMLWEADLWAKRLAALEAGLLRYYRILGVKSH